MLYPNRTGTRKVNRGNGRVTFPCRGRAVGKYRVDWYLEPGAFAMTTASHLTGVIRQFPSTAGDALPDAELLACYAGHRDEAAFAAVVRRYGGLVLGVARRQLADPQQADDVFQATFLALARSAGRLHRQTPLANWLYTVALRQARKARARSARRAEVEQAAPPRPVTGNDPLAEISGRELLRVIDEELARLPERYRLPVLLCCVQGLSREEAAGQLGWSDGVVKGRLERGRRRLADRLTARGLTPSAAVLAPLVGAAVPAELAARTVPLAAAPWAMSVPPAVGALAAAVAPRRLLPAVACWLVVAGLAGWVIASGGTAPAQPAPPPPGRAEPAAALPDDRLPAGSTVRFGTSRYRQGSTIARIAISPDGTTAAVTSGGHIYGATRGFDLTDGRVLFTLPPIRPFHAEAVAISDDGQTLAVKASNTIQLYDARTGAPGQTVKLPDTSGGTMTEWIVFTPDGKSVALTQGNSHGVVLVDLEKETTRVFACKGTIYAAAFSPDGSRMVTGGYDSEKEGAVVRVWDVAAGKELRRMRHGGGLRTVTFSPNGKTIAAGGDDGWARIWDADTGKELFNLPKGGYRVRCVAFAPDGDTLAVAGDVIRLFDPVNGTELGMIDRQATGLRFSADGKVLAGAVTGTIYRWSTATLKPLTPEAAGESMISQVIASPDGRHVVTRGSDGDANLWDARTGAHLRHVKVTWQRGMALSPDGRFLVWPAEDEKVKFTDPAQPNAIHTGSRLRLYDLTAGTFVERFPGFEGDAQEVFFTPDGRTVVTVDHRDGKVRLWDFATGKEQRSFRVVRADEAARQHHVWGAVLSPDGKSLAVTYQPSGRGIFSPFAVRLWDVATGNERHELAGHFRYVSMAFSPDSRTLVTVSEPLAQFAQEQMNLPVNQVFVWDVATGQRVKALPDGLPAGAVCAAFSPDGRTLATSVPDGTAAATIQLWDVATWKPRAEFRGHRDQVLVLTFTPDGRLLSGGVDTTVLAWDMRQPRPEK